MKKPWLIVGVLIVVVVGFWLISSIFKNKNSVTAKNAKKSGTGNSSGGSGQITNLTATHGAMNTSIFPLKRGSDHEAVRYLKMAINYISQRKGTPANLVLTKDATVFGAATESALYNLYGQKVVDKTLAKRIANDADLPEFTSALNYLN